MICKYPDKIIPIASIQAKMAVRRSDKDNSVRVLI
jgi:hypothetical protein